MKRIYLFKVFILVFAKIFAQSIPNDSNLSFPGEQLYIHTNNTLFFPGEYIYYSLYLRNFDGTKTGQQSLVAYLQLIDKESNVVVTQKMILDGGIGSGDLFVSESIPSGSYKLIAFTELIKNMGVTNFYKQDIVIINPYQTNQTGIIIDDSFQEKNDRIAFEKKKTEHWGLSINKSLFKKRDSVILKISFKDSLAKFSISIRRKNDIASPQRETSQMFIKTRPSKPTHFRHLKTLPEIRGELISGRLLSKQSQEPIKNKTISLSLAGDPFQFKQVSTNEKGEFYFTLSEHYKSTQYIIQPLEDSSAPLEIELYKKNDVDYSSFNFPSYTISTNDFDLLTKRSIRNQIENAYFSFKSDSINPLTQKLYFNESKKEVFNLDDYTRFKTFEETCVEIIGSIVVQRNKNKEKSVFVKTSTGQVVDFGIIPLILMNGVVVEDFQKLLSYDARKIRSIAIYREPYVFGSTRYQGAIIIYTFNDDEKILKQGSNSIVMDIKPPQLTKRFFNQKHDLSSKRIPDERHQLLWIPQAHKFQKEPFSYKFFTSDVLGVFYIEVEGFSSSGEPISLSTSFEVR